MGAARSQEMLTDAPSLVWRALRDGYFAVEHPQPLPQWQVPLHAQFSPHVQRSIAATAQPQLAFAH